MHDLDISHRSLTSYHRWLLVEDEGGSGGKRSRFGGDFTLHNHWFSHIPPAACADQHVSVTLSEKDKHELKAGHQKSKLRFNKNDHQNLKLRFNG